MSASESETDANPPDAGDASGPTSEPSRREGVVSVTYWMIAGAIYCVLGIMVPWMFFLGFWQALLYVAGVTALQPFIVRRFA